MTQPTAHARSAGHPFGKLAGLLLSAALGYTGYRHQQNILAMKLREQDLRPAIQAAAGNAFVRPAALREASVTPLERGTLVAWALPHF